jgi:hypothetical protein
MNRITAIVVGSSLCVLTFAFADDQAVNNDKVITPVSAAADQRFDSHIDAWAKGEITALDLANNKVSIKGISMPFATASAKMQVEIRDRTANLTDPTEKLKKESEIRSSWQAKLDSAASESPGKESTFDFRIPAKETVAVLEGNQVADVEFLHRDRDLTALNQTDTGVVGAPVINDKQMDTATSGSKVDTLPATDASKLSLSDLKVGQKVKVGYDSGLINSDVYAIVNCDKK